MTPQFEAAYQLHQFLTAHKVPYVIIGGLAVQRWGDPRFTRDVDVTLLVSPEEEEGLLSGLLRVFTPRIPDALAFARQNRVLLVRTPEGCDLDISLGISGYEEEVVARAVNYDLGNGRTVRLCSAEDLIIHKAIAGRPQDCADIEGILLRQGHALDTRYVERWLRELSRVVEMDEIYQRFAMPWKRLMGKRPSAGSHC